MHHKASLFLSADSEQWQETDKTTYTNAHQANVQMLSTQTAIIGIDGGREVSGIAGIDFWLHTCSLQQVLNN